MRNANPFAYPAKVEQDGDEYIIEFRDIEGAITYAESKDKIAEDGLSAIKDMFCAFVEDKKPFPTASAPKHGEVLIEVPLSFAIKIVLHNAMLANRYRQCDLARLLGVPTSEVARIVNPRKPVKIDTMVSAVKAVGGSVSLAFAL